jgi:hypothetical protein
VPEASDKIWFTVLLGPGLVEIEIQIEIEIGFAIMRWGRPDVVSPTTKAAEHYRHSVQLRFATQAFCFIHGFASHKNILNGCALQGRTPGNFEVSPAVCLGGLSIAFGNV